MTMAPRGWPTITIGSNRDVDATASVLALRVDPESGTVCGRAAPTLRRIRSMSGWAPGCGPCGAPPPERRMSLAVVGVPCAAA